MSVCLCKVCRSIFERWHAVFFFMKDPAPAGFSLIEQKEDDKLFDQVIGECRDYEQGLFDQAF